MSFNMYINVVDTISNTGQPIPQSSRIMVSYPSIEEDFQDFCDWVVKALRGIVLHASN